MPRRNFRMSHEWADLQYEDRRIAELERGPLRSAGYPLTATIGRNAYGGFYAWLRGWGYPTVRELPDFELEPRAAEDALDELVSNGYELLDPDNLIRLYDLFDEGVSIAEQDADSAGYPGIGGHAGYAADNVQRMIDLMDTECF